MRLERASGISLEGPRTLEGLENLLQAILQDLDRIHELLSGRVGLDTMEGILVSATTAAPGVDFTVTHGLGRIPTVYIPTITDTNLAATNVTIYRGEVAWTETTITLRSTVEGVSLNLYIL